MRRTTQRWQSVGPAVIGQAGKRTPCSDEHVKKTIAQLAEFKCFLTCDGMFGYISQCLLTHQVLADA